MTITDLFHLSHVPDTLPDKLSDLLELAWNDAQVIKDAPGYALYLNSWHSPRVQLDGVTCEVCLAGAVMANTLHVPPDLDAYPGHFNGSLRRKLQAINKARLGHWWSLAEHQSPFHLSPALYADMDRDLGHLVDRHTGEHFPAVVAWLRARNL